MSNVNKRLPWFPGACMRRRRGQAMIEYMIVAVMLMALVAVFALLLYALRQQSGRVLELVASEYP
jgi:Flp pilus assembly protein TadG